MRIVRLFNDRVDFISQWIGEKAALLFIPLTCIAFFEVVMRYAFNSPTVWAWDVNIQLGAALIALAGGFILLKEFFVRVDVIVNHLPAKLNRWLDLVLSVVPLFAVGVLAQLAIRQAWQSLLNQESLSSTWMPPLYPLRIVVAAGFILLFLQIVSRTLRTLLICLTEEKNGFSQRG